MRHLIIPVRVRVSTYAKNVNNIEEIHFEGEDEDENRKATDTVQKLSVQIIKL
jgi:hypothetical protein